MVFAVNCEPGARSPALVGLQSRFVVKVEEREAIVSRLGREMIHGSEVLRAGLPVKAQEQVANRAFHLLISPQI